MSERLTNYLPAFTGTSNGIRAALGFLVSPISFWMTAESLYLAGGVH